MADRPLFSLELFHRIPEITHVCAAGESLPLKGQSKALEKYMKDKSSGHIGRFHQTQYLDDVRTLVSQAWGVANHEVGFAPSVADGVSMVLESLDWRDDDNVCVHVDEFPSLVGPFAFKHQQKQKDSRGGPIKSPEVIYYKRNELQEKVNERTRLIAVSYVSYYDGTRVDLSFYRQVADSVGAILLVDFTQAAGYTPIDASVADFAFSACYKWLLGTTGAAIAYWNQSKMPNWRPITGGWHSLALGAVRPQWESHFLEARNDAMCFSRGNPAHLPIYVLRESLEYLKQWDASKIEEHVQTLTTALLERLKTKSIHSSTPTAKDQHGASVTVDCERASEIVDEMAKAGIYAWNGQGRVRFSFHGYNCIKDVDRIMEVFPTLWKKFNQTSSKI
ncbi:PLP-dependent transferase [Aspergillus steynii IBT 23096]|uniref:PLP-dependent transferase n=1 Tax=Aspergillus steynii IBT 23096 TaxID=1392250 RepID=A0A2I2GH70_9EURO|nr:PLP-dependent transferase [Aspergillus steynii IBT 23096]PLB52230.1 PLP-dependent transferase [Aspergillus steynii IBT 23096]